MKTVFRILCSSNVKKFILHLSWNVFHEEDKCSEWSENDKLSCLFVSWISMRLTNCLQNIYQQCINCMLIAHVDKTSTLLFTCI